MNVNWDWNIVNDHFKPLINCQDRYLIMYGGRGSSKSDFAAKKLIYNCLTHKHFRCIMIRRIQAKVKESCYRNLKDIITDYNLHSLFTFTSTPVPRIECKNGNFFVGAGTDNISSIKSTKDPSSVWWEEDIPDEDDFITVTTSLRTLKAPLIQEVFSVNPECEGDYKDLWFYKRFFAHHYEKGEMSFSDKVETEVDGLKVIVPFTVHHSTHEDNPHLPDQYRAMLMSLKKTNPYYYDVYTRGRWGTRIVEGRFYKQFNQAKHTFNGENRYVKNIPLHITFDFNVQPYVSLSIWHIIGSKMICIDEIAAREPHNSTKGICALFREKYKSHEGGLFIYGDATGRAEDTKSERGHNNFSIIMKELSAFHPQKRVPLSNPSVAMRGNFINSIFQNNEQGLSIEINEKCTHLTSDLLFGKQASDGTKFKEEGKDKETGIRVQKYHHFSDGMDYLIIKAFQEEYNKFKSIGDLGQYKHGKSDTWYNGKTVTHLK